MGDLTIIYVTANEMQSHWVDFQLDKLVQASEGAPIICVSRQPMAFGCKQVLDQEPKSYWNIYHQLLLATRLAETPFVAMAEDDTLYTREHFYEFRPPLDAVSYNRSRWSLFTWEARPLYCLRNRISNCSLIAPREYLVAALEDRERRWPNGARHDYLVGEVGREIVERNLDVPRRKMVEWYSTEAIVQLNHVNGTDGRQKAKWKKHGQIKAWDIPHWGTAKGVVDVYKGNR